MLTFFYKVFEDVLTEVTENYRFRPTRCRLTPPLQGTRANSRINLILPETIAMHWATFLSLIACVYIHSNFHGSLRKTHILCNRVRNGRSRSPKVVDFGTNRMRVCNFLLLINSNLVLILLRFRDFTGFLPKQQTHRYSSPKFGDVPLELDRRCWATNSEASRLIIPAINFEVNQPIWQHTMAIPRYGHTSCLKKNCASVIFWITPWNNGRC